MNNTEASEENVKSPSTYGNKGYEEYRKREKRKNKTDPDKESLNTGISYTKYAVGGESKEVPATGLDENDNYIHRRQQNQTKQKKSIKKK
ncbi:MAG: hypothetical protein QOK54_08740 [Nitrososphaeraceae archaeon]|nr:hypothetical protein [Nitrososphaeraceae archaeon]MDW0171496.1 hypothetical protein [Nitrososphaeraceae archaeon]MDW0180909.1 hypothetical protein [Nitrososphaeraceae archaeon]MDW0195560.1 hypothetical protein [Nitrososphaeraceae archaeon]MDW0205406.1 hypothetical protein [Nitrososphaeraceae archaeon]